METSPLKVGDVASEKDTPNLEEVRILLSATVSKYEFLVTPLDDNKSLILRVINTIERDPYASPEALGLQRTLPENVKVIPGKEVPGRQTIAVAQPIAIVDNKKKTIFEPVYTAKPGAPVYRLADKKLISMVYGLPKDSADVLILGYEYFSGVVIPVSYKVLPRHILILGTTGTGKSWLRGILLEELHRLGIPQLLFDINAEYIQATKELGGVILRPGENFTISLSSIPEIIFAELISRVLPTEFQQAIALWAFKLYLEEVSKTGWERGAARYLQLVEEAGVQLRARQDSILNTKVRMNTWFGRMSRVIGEGHDWEETFKNYKICTIDCSGLGEWETELVVSTISKQLLDLRVKKKIPPLVLSLDEAHRFVPRGKTTATSIILRDLIRRGRHQGISVIIITQYPDSIDREILRIPNMKFIFAIEPGHLGEMRVLISDLPKELINYIPSLPRGTCILTGTREIVERSLLMRVSSNRKTTHGGKTPDMLEEVKMFYGGHK